MDNKCSHTIKLHNLNLKLTFRDSTDQWEYYMAFNINERDATGQNILYVASLLGNKRMLDVILGFRVKATRIHPVSKPFWEGTAKH